MRLPYVSIRFVNFLRLYEEVNSIHRGSSIEKLLDAYHSQDIEKTFGKGYEELKSDWLAYLYN